MANTNNTIKTPNNVGGMFGYNFYNSNIANNEKLTLKQKQKKIDFNNNIGQIAMIAQGLGSLIEGYAASRQDTTPLEQRVGLYDLGGQLMGGMQVGMGALQLGSNAFNQYKIANTKQLKEQIRDFGTKQSTAMSFDDLAKEYDQYSALKHISARDLRGNSYLQDGANMLASAGSGAATGAMFGPIGAGIGAAIGGLTSFLGSNRGRHKAKEEATKINKLSDWANTSRQSILGYRGGEISESNFLDMMRNYGTEDEGVNVQAYGGPMFTQGGIWDNNLTYINNGGTHEQNPIEGVPMGVAPDGTPNLVEEGEIIWNDYVFSNRLKLPKRLLDKYKLGGKLTFAEAVDALTKQSKEMPNDPITKATNDVILSELQNEQELVRMNRQKNKLKKNNSQENNPNSHAFGGRKYSGEEDYSSQLVNQDDSYEDPIPERVRTKINTRKPVPVGKVQLSLINTFDPYTYNPYSDMYIIPETIKQNSPIFNTSLSEDMIRTVKDGTYDQKYGNNKKKHKNETSYSTSLRYAPIVMSGIQALTDLTGITNKPKYNESERLKRAAREAKTYTPVGYSPISTYLTYKPVDPTIALNQSAAANAANKRTLSELAINPLTARAGILANEYAYQLGIGEIMRKAQEENWNRRKDVQTFNRGTEATNRELAMKAAIQNQQAEQNALNRYLQYTGAAEQLGYDERMLMAQTRAQNLSNFINNLGGLGKERVVESWVNNGLLPYSISTDGSGITYNAGR